MKQAPQEKPAELTDNDYQRIAESIRRIGEVGKKLTASGLNRKAVTVLLHHATNVSKRDIGFVLNGIEALPRLFLTKP